MTINLIYFFLSSKLISHKPSFSLPWAERQTADTPRHLEVKILTMLLMMMVMVGVNGDDGLGQISRQLIPSHDHVEVN